MTCFRDCIVHKWFDNDGDDDGDDDDSDDDGGGGGIDNNYNGDDDDVVDDDDNDDDDHDDNGNDDDDGDDDELVNWCFEPSQPARDYIRDENKVMMMMTTTRIMITRTRTHSLTSVIVPLVDCIRVSLVYTESVLLSGNS